MGRVVCVLLDREEVAEKPLALLKQEVEGERRKQIQHMQEVVASREYEQVIATCSKEFEEKRREFLSLLENQPGFLQSSFLSLHRKLCQQYK